MVNKTTNKAINSITLQYQLFVGRELKLHGFYVVIVCIIRSGITTDVDYRLASGNVLDFLQSQEVTIFILVSAKRSISNCFIRSTHRSEGYAVAQTIDPTGLDVLGKGVLSGNFKCCISFCNNETRVRCGLCRTPCAESAVGLTCMQVVATYAIGILSNQQASLITHCLITYKSWNGLQVDVVLVACTANHNVETCSLVLESIGSRSLV